jgi:protocatechuate 3,4-dioxygenase alpha subunit
MSLQPTSSQTSGPYVHIGFAWLVVDNLAAPGTAGERIAIEARIVDGDGQPVNDAVVEIWQANAHGRYAHPDDTQDKPLDPSFKGFGRVFTDDRGRFRITTIKPGPVPGPAGTIQAPHLNVTILTRGLMKQLVTRMYFANDPGNAADPVLARVPQDRRDTLMATPVDGGYAWSVVLQGPGETVFFEC